jgi:hypothetical protein
MIRKIIPALLILVMVSVLSCDNEPVNPAKKEEANVAPPPVLSTVYMHGRLGPIGSVDVYYRNMDNIAGWIYLCTVTSTQCDSILGSFQVNSGDDVQVLCLEAGTLVGRSFLARLAAGCPNSQTGTSYCGDLDYGSSFQFTVSSSMDFAIETQGFGCPVQ